MSGEHLIVMMRVQVAFGAVEGQRLLQTHHDGVGETAQEHHKTEDHIHDADLLVIDAGEPFLPEIAPQAEVSKTSHER